jgi:hypothetical protein
MEKTCFVISPIGAPGSEIREHADDVLECIIVPAMQQLDIVAKRADEFADPGVITDQMIKAILAADICIVLLTGHNPNVFYELAIAQASDRPVLMLIQEGETIPFDIRHFRIIKYDLKPRSIFSKIWISQVVDSAAILLNPDYQRPKLLVGSVLKNHTGGSPYWISGTSEEFGAPPKFFSIVREATDVCDLMGISLASSWGGMEARKILLEKAEQNCRIRFLILHPENPGLGSLVNTQLPAVRLNDVQHQIEDMSKYFWDLTADKSNIEIRQIKNGIPHFQLIATDKTVLCLQYMFSRGSGESPLLQFPAGTQLYKVFREEFDELWQYNNTTL